MGEVLGSDPLLTADIASAAQPSEPAPAPGGLAGRLMLPSDFDEIRLFALLLWRFKAPNGFLSFLGPEGGDPDGPFKWDFLLQTNGVHIQVIRSVNGLELWWWGRSAAPEHVVEYLTRNMDLHCDDIDRVIATLEEYALLLNPYARHKNMAALARDELVQLEPKPPTTPVAPGTPEDELHAFGRALQDYYKVIDRQAMYSMLLVTESAYMAEAYLNLLYAILMRPVLRQSGQLQAECLLRKWRSKIEHLPADCLHVAKSPDMGDTRIRDAKWLFGLRNRIAHSYPDRSEMKVGKMWFFQRFPVFPVAAPSAELARVLVNQLPTRDEALRAHAVAEALVTFLRDLVDPEVAQTLDMVAGAQPLGYNETKAIYGVPFADFTLFVPGMGPAA